MWILSFIFGVSETPKFPLLMNGKKGLGIGLVEPPNALADSSSIAFPMHNGIQGLYHATQALMSAMPKRSSRIPRSSRLATARAGFPGQSAVCKDFEWWRLSREELVDEIMNGTALTIDVADLVGLR